MTAVSFKTSTSSRQKCQCGRNRIANRSSANAACARSGGRPAARLRRERGPHSTARSSDSATTRPNRPMAMFWCVAVRISRRASVTSAMTTT